MLKQNSAAKAPYAKPELMVYGNFAQLTASGSVNNVETGIPGMGNGPMMVRP